MFNDELLEKYINTFLGYGNQNGDICFIVLEEGIGVRNQILEENPELGFKEVNKKLSTWMEMGETQVVDGRDFHLKTNDLWHKETSDIQKTWEGMIRTILSYENKDCSYSNILNFQINRLGRLNENHSLIEFRPLPSKSFRGSQWFYKFFSKLNYLRSKKDYEDYITNKRIKLIQDFIRTSSFRFIVFLSIGSHFRHYWEKISNTEFKNIQKDFLVCPNNKFFITHHPTSYPKKESLVSGGLKEVYKDLGQYLRELMNNSK